jgi:hypothetical protein
MRLLWETFYVPPSLKFLSNSYYSYFFADRLVPLAALSLVSARVLWASVLTSYSDIIRQANPVDHGRLGGITLQVSNSEWLTTLQPCHSGHLALTKSISMLTRSGPGGLLRLKHVTSVNSLLAVPILTLVSCVNEAILRRRDTPTFRK